VAHGIALGVALEPLRMGLHGVFPIEVGTHARDHVHAALLGGGAALAEEIAVAQELALAVERHLGLVERQYSGDAHHHGVHLQAGPVVRPLLDVQHDGVVLGHIESGRDGGFSAATPAARKVILMKDLRRTYLGLGTACVTCHEDKHKGQLGDKCERCHTVANTAAKWKDVTRFDHSTAKYKLAGAHAKVECAKCHGTLPSPMPPRKVIRYTGIPFAQCADCHKDPHRGSFAAGCNSCHNDSAWKPARNTRLVIRPFQDEIPAARQARAGGLRQVPQDRRLQGPGGARCSVRPVIRTSMGGNSPHAPTRATAPAAIPPMAGSPPPIPWSSHAKSLYPLLGKHAAVACDKCHLPARAATVIRFGIRSA
jgi:hypothetical protein